MSAINWLDHRDGLAAFPDTPQPAAQPGSAATRRAPSLRRPPGASGPVNESPVASAVVVPEVTTRSLDEAQIGAVGLLPRSVTGLPPTLWQTSRTAALNRLLSGLDVSHLPAMQSLLYTLLLAESDPPGDDRDGTAFLLTRIDRLTDLGAVEPAMALIERAGPTASPEVFARWFDLSLLSGEENAACATMTEQPTLAPSITALAFCRARLGDWDTAALTYGGASALGLLPKAEDRLLRLYLDPELAEETPPMPPPAEMTPLAFRLAESIGTPLPSAGLPRAYAMADLRGISGWRAEIEAAERLARTGALAENRLLGIYTDRRPAASGGLWDRVDLLQQLDRALSAQDPGAVQSVLPNAWSAIRQAELELPFARLWGATLSGMPLTDAAARTAFDVALLSPEYEALAQGLAKRTPREAYLAALASGRPGEATAPDRIAAAITRGFAPDAAIPPTLRAVLQQGRLGEAVLIAMTYYARAAQGETKDIAPALATLRVVGLEDSARRAALQLMILEQRL